MSQSSIKNPAELNHVFWIDIAKVLTMILVIVGHSTYYQIVTDYGGIEMLPPSNEQSLSFKLLNSLNGFIYSFHMPFFMALSGMTMAISIRRSTGISSFITKKARRLLIPFLTVTIFLSVPMKYIAGYWSTSKNILEDIVLGQGLLLGNSHLWFIASLFIISVIFYLLYTYNLNKGTVYWLIVVICSVIGRYIESRNSLLGIGAAMKYYIFFALGYCFFEKISSISISLLKTCLLWIGMVIGYIIQSSFIHKYSPNILFISYYILAIWGCLNMIATAKLILRIPNIHNNRIYKLLNRYSYELYLYSDPFNYLLIFIFFFWMGYGYATDSILSIIAYLARIIISIILSLVVVWLVSLPVSIRDKSKEEHKN